jgi:Putative zinc-finger
MGSHEEFLELCAAATAGELSVEERARLSVHLAACPDCRRAMSEYQATRRATVTALTRELAPVEVSAGDSWSREDAEKTFFKRLDIEQQRGQSPGQTDGLKTGRRFSYRPSQIHWREVWMTFAAAILLAIALGIASYRSGVKRGTDAVRTIPAGPKDSTNSLEQQASDAGYERAQLQAKLRENADVIDDLRHRLADQIRIVNHLRSKAAIEQHSDGANKESKQDVGDTTAERDAELSAAQEKLAELQKTVEAATAQRDENARRAASLAAKVNELTELVRDREEALDQTNAEVAKGQELLEHDRDIRELMGARELYMADVHDVSGKGTEKTYGRIFYTKGKSLIFYAFDLDGRPGVQNASSFQAWGRRGPDKQEASSLGIFYEDNIGKKRWVLKADDPKSLADIDAVFVTVEPSGGSQHPSGKPLLFAYLRVSPNHP